MNFFCTKEHYQEWIKTADVNDDEVFILDAKEALQVAKMLFGLEKAKGLIE